MSRRLGPLHKPRPSTVAIGALVLMVAVAPFLPHGADEDGAIGPASVPDGQLLRATASAGRVTPAMQREIDAVVGQGRTALRATSARTGPEGLLRATIRCATFEEQQYCLGTGWTQTPQETVVGRLARAASTRRAPVEQTGDLDVLAQARQRAALPAAARERAERAELTAAARSVAKVWLLRHQVQGEALPAGFLARHPEVKLAEPTGSTTAGSTTAGSTTYARAATTTTTTTTSASPSPTSTTTTVPTAEEKGGWEYPERDAILSTSRVSEQIRSYWCGPTSMQMIEWNWNGTRQSQEFWAGKLGTTSSGTSITEMVRVTNAYTGWDRADRAGTYITLDIGDWSYQRWWVLQMRHIHDYNAPVILHPVLLKAYYPYLDDDASGHFQVGRGYDKNGDSANSISYFEPWNQQRFDPSEPYIARVQWRSAYRSYRANKAHFQHNIGV